MELAVDEQEHVLRLSRSELNALLLERGFETPSNNCWRPVSPAVAATTAALKIWRAWWPSERCPAAPPAPVALRAHGASPCSCRHRWSRGPGCASTHARGRHSGCAATRRFPPFWDQRSNSHRWHPLFVAGQPWPSPAPGAGAGRQPDRPTQLGAGAGGAHPQGSHSVVFIDGLPTLQEQTAGEISHQPWPGTELVLPLEPAGEQGEDCLRLRWSIDKEAQLQLEINDLRSGQSWSHPTLGAVR